LASAALVVVLACGVSQDSGFAQAQKRPNILFTMTDDPAYANAMRTLSNQLHRLECCQADACRDAENDS
jgi:hypothetical protein